MLKSNTNRSMVGPINNLNNQLNKVRNVPSL